MIKRIKYIVLVMVAFMMFKSDVNAGSLSIWASASNIEVGSKVTVSVNAKNVAGTFNVTSSNNSVLSGGVTGEWMEDDTYTYTFTAKAEGKATITVLAVDAADFDTDGGFTGAKSVTLNVVAKKQSSSGGSSGSGSSKPSTGGNNSTGGTTADKKEYSSDNTLKSLSIEGYDIEPKFNKDTTEYKLTVDEKVEKINVRAEVNHNKASVKGTGEINLSSGENTIEVKVTAENGNDKIYKIIVNVTDLNPIKVKVGSDEYTIVKKNNDLIEKLDYYEEVVLNIEEQEVVAYENIKTNVTLVLLKDKDNKINYYIFDKYKNTYIEYNYISVGGITLQLLDNDNELKNYKRYDLELQDNKINYYKIKGSHKVGLIYGTNVKSGNTGYYVYDKNEDTLSKYYDEEINIYKEEATRYKSYLMFTLGGIALVSIILIINSIQKSKKKRKNRYNF